MFHEDYVHGEVANLLAKYFIQTNIDYSVCLFHTAEELLAAPFNYSILLLDIMLNDGNSGIDVGIKLREMGNNSLLIYLTSRKDMYKYGYDAQAMDFIIKPVVYNDFSSKMDKAFDRLFSSRKVLSIAHYDEFLFIDQDAIIMIQSHPLNRKRCIYTTAGIHEVTESIGELYEQLEENHYHTFFRSHRSYICNLFHVDGNNATEIFLTNGNVSKLSKNLVREYSARLTSYMMKPK